LKVVANADDRRIDVVVNVILIARTRERVENLVVCAEVVNLVEDDDDSPTDIVHRVPEVVEDLLHRMPIGVLATEFLTEPTRERVARGDSLTGEEYRCQIEILSVSKRLQFGQLCLRGRRLPLASLPRKERVLGAGTTGLRASTTVEASRSVLPPGSVVGV